MASEKITAMIEEVKTLSWSMLWKRNSAFPPLLLLSLLPLPALLLLKKRRPSSTSC